MLGRSSLLIEPRQHLSGITCSMFFFFTMCSSHCIPDQMDMDIGRDDRQVIGH